MRWHIIFPFFCVLKNRITVRHEPGKKALEIVANFRICIFLDQEGSRRVLDVEREQPCLYPGRADPPQHVLCERVKTRACGAHDELFDRLSQDKRSVPLPTTRSPRAAGTT